MYNYTYDAVNKKLNETHNDIKKNIVESLANFEKAKKITSEILKK